MTTEKFNQNLAKSLGVSVSDMLYFARSIAISLENDKAKDCFLNGSEQDRIGFVQAYAPEAVKKFQTFVSIYKTKKGAAEAFRATIFPKIILATVFDK